jgi:hypothetical protein
MIAAYHGKTDYSAAELLAVNPFAPACKPLRGFGGVTACLGRARDAPMPFKANPYTLPSQRMKSH